MKTKTALLVAALLFSAGCHRIQIRTGTPASNIEGSEVGATFLWGITPVTVRASECRNGISSATSITPWWGVLAWGLTSGFVEPIETEYRCAEAPAPTQAAPQAPVVSDAR